MGKLRYAASMELPSDTELTQIRQLLAECSAEVCSLAGRDDDVVGELRICRFLRACQGDVGQALTWFRTFLRWRVESGIDALRKDVIGLTPEELLSWWSRRANPYLPFCPYAGRNGDGHVIWYMRQGLMDAEKFVGHRRRPMREDLSLINTLMEWTFWHLNVLSRTEGRMICVVKVNDFYGMGADGRRLPFLVPQFQTFLMEMVSNDRIYYCEHTTLFLVTNAPFVLRAFFGLARRLLTKRQASKIMVLGDTCQATVRASLGELIPASALPRDYGGDLMVAPNAFPIATPEEVDEWYRLRHLPSNAEALDASHSPHVGERQVHGQDGGFVKGRERREQGTRLSL
mmetsp:Transcript_4525/g.11370  ORF Transcript_4525/g.11370 Transcript_4525/m.11370 type:complete len:344 (-) Transcript_4525:567-1598(-)|eukprot:CAMPEP_0117472114 /NCGR_PEP_ID=MMETSP0784-20121206/8078_1 /TAXON_ID=39447 /ORGANISM="" /LENGTH=343 /DNA_ID=CAMNT_0005266251 /DNA_START=61 /DNA_END=1092 /DNA_ORIENTATION=+